MSEYIEKEAVINFIENGLNNPDETKSFGHDAIEIMAEVRYMPAADVVEVKHGKWIRPNVPNTRSYKWQCSECGQIACWLHYGNRGSKNIICKFGYCPHCGARMDGDT